jgi:plastocyanin
MTGCPRPVGAARCLVALVAFAAGALLALGRPDARASAGAASIEVSDGAGQPLADAAVWLEPVDPKALPPAAAGAARASTIEQAGRRFAPRTTVVRVGTAVSFPNNDTVRHHVYSFSPARTFELKLYAGVPAAPVVFDKPGNVVLGCNIHDRMVAWVQVVDTPWFGRSGADGRVSVGPMPPGEYRLRAFHPDQRDAVPERRVTLGADVETLALRIELGPGPARQ